MKSKIKILILGIGNYIGYDDSFGPRLIELLFSRGNITVDEFVTIMSGDTDGLALMRPVQNADILILIDAMNLGNEKPGTFKRMERNNICSKQAVKLSTHGIDFMTCLEFVKAQTGKLPKMIIFGVQPKIIQPYTAEISPEVEAALVPVAKLVETEVCSIKRKNL